MTLALSLALVMSLAIATWFEDTDVRAARASRALHATVFLLALGSLGRGIYDQDAVDIVVAFIVAGFAAKWTLDAAIHVEDLQIRADMESEVPRG